MSNNKPIKKIPNRNFTFFGGIALCLFSVILILNVGYVARAFALPFTYLFGLGAYVIYITIYAFGLYMFFKEKALKVKLNNFFFGGLVIFISVLMIATLIILNVSSAEVAINKEGARNFAAYYKEVFQNIGKNKDGVATGYWKTGFINLFVGNNFGGGFIGYALVAACYQVMGTAGAWVIAVLIFLLGLFIIFFPSIKKIITSNKSAKPVKKQKEEYQQPEREVYRDEPVVQQRQRRVENVNVIANASRIDDIREESEPIYQNSPANYPQNGSIYVQNTVNNSQPSYGAGSNFVPARFSKFIAKPAPEVIPAALQPTIQPQPQPQTARPIGPMVQPSVNEQLQLDFNQRQQLDESLVTAQPEYMEPVNVQSQQVMQPQPQPQVVQPAPQPVVKKPIKWVPPSSDLLETLEVSGALELNNQVAEERMIAINQIFEDYAIGARCNTYVVGPAVTRYNIEYNSNVSIRAVESKVEDVARRLGGVMARFASIVPGHSYSGLEIPNAKITAVSFKEVFESLPDVKKHPLSVVFGKNIESQYIKADFDEFPHVLVAGTTGSGKSIFTHSVVCTFIMRNSPEDLKLVLIDPKRVEMNKYRDLPHLLCPIINDAEVAKLTMSKLCDEMNRRYEVLMNNGVSNITQYKELLEENPNLEKMPFIVVIVDEYADLVDSCKDIKQPVVSIAQKARAAGIHMLIATQRPSTSIIDGVIKGNLPTRVALSVASYVDSMTILDVGGGEKLLGKGDMLIKTPLLAESRTCPMRLQGCFIQNKEINRIVGYLKEHYECNYDPNFCNLQEASAQAAGDVIGSPEFLASQEGSEEAKYQSVKDWVMSNEYMSMSRIQRECSVGFNRAGRFFKRLQDEGIVATDTEGNKGCPVLVHEKFYEGSAETDIPVSSDQSEY